MKRLLRALLERALPDGDWTDAFLEELEAEYERHLRARGKARAAAWYARQLVSPWSWRFIWLMRTRARRRNRHSGRGGGMHGSMERDRAAASGGWLRGWLTECGQVARSLARQPRFTTFVIGTLAIGLGGVTAMFGVADRLFLSGPAGIEAPNQVVRLFLRVESAGGGVRLAPWIPSRTLEAIRTGTTVLEGLVYFRREEHLTEIGNDISTRRVGVTSPDFFAVLGTTPVLGRFPDPGETNVAVLSHALWEEHFGGSTAALGARIEFPDGPRTVIGIAPRGFAGVGLESVDVWTPLDPVGSANLNWLTVARVSGPAEGRLVRAAAAVQPIHERTDPGPFSQWARQGQFVATPLNADDAGAEPAEAAVARILLGVMALVLIIAVANVANLFLARLTRRRREVAVRRAFGVGSGRLARLLFTESLLLATGAAVAAVPVAHLLGSFLRGVLLPTVPWDSAPVGGGAMGITFAVALSAGSLIGVLPLRRALGEDIAATLRGAGGGEQRGHHRLHSVLAAGQIALSATLLVGAGLFLKSFRTMHVTDLGFDAHDVVAVSLLSLDPQGIPTPSEEEHRLYLAALEAAGTQPGIEHAVLSLGLPFLYNFGPRIFVPGLDSIPALPGGGPYLTAVTAGYFEAVGTGILQGRGFTDDEVAGNAEVIVVSERMAATLWPDESALGRCLRLDTPENPCLRIVGVAEDVHRIGYREPPSMQFYVPLGPPGRFGGMALLVREAEPGALVALRTRLLEIDPVIAHTQVTTVSDALDPQIRPWRLGAWVLGLASLLALVVALTGVYGVLSYLVERRRREIGVRIALGASRAQIQRMVVGQGMNAALVGAAAAVVLVWASAPWVGPLLFETDVFDPFVWPAAGVIVSAVALLAGALPAARAASVEATVSLNEE